MNARDHIDDYLLGHLSAEESSRLERASSEDPQLKDRIDTGRALTDLLARMEGDAWTPRPAPPLTINPTHRGERATERPGQRRPWFAPRPAVALASAVALIAVGALGATVAQRIAHPGETGGATVQLAAIGKLDPNASGAVRLSPDGRIATVSVTGLEPNRRGDYYEMWLMNSGTDLVSAGGFRVGADGRAKVEVPMPASMDDYRYFDISLEQAGGAPGHSGKSVVRSGPSPATVAAAAPAPATKENREIDISRNRQQETPTTTAQERTSPMNNLDQPLRERKRNTLKAPQRDPLPEPTKPARREALGITCRPLPVLSLTVCSSSTAGRGITGTTNGISGKAFLTALAASLAMATSLGVDGASAALPALPSGCEPNAERTSVICVGEPGAIATAKRMNGCWSLEDGSTLCVDPPEPSKPEACDYAAGECGVVIDPDRDRCVIPGRTSPLEFIVSGKVLSVDWPWGNDGADDSKLVASQQALATALESGDYAYLTATCDPEGQGLIDPRRGDQTTASEAQPIPGASADDSSRGDTAGSPDGATADPSTIGGEAPAFSDSSILPAACELAECDFTVDPNAEDQCFMPGIDSDQPRASFVISGDRVLAVNVPWGQDPGFDSAVYNNTRRTVFAAVSGNWEDIFSRCDANLVASTGRALGVHAWLTRDELDRMAPFLNYPGLPANSIPGESPTTKPDGSVPTLRAESAGSGKSGDRAATSRKASGQSGRAKTGSKAQTGRQGRSGKRKGVRRGAPTRVIHSKRTSGHSKLKSGKRR